MRPWGHTGGGTRRISARLLVTLVAAAALLFALPASAHALALSGLAAAPDDTQAGAHSDFNIHMDFSGGQVKDLTIGLPPGLVGDPNAAPLCTVTELNAASCPPDTAVGSVTASAQVSVLGIPLPITASGSLYNLTPQAGEPARFGIVLNPLGLPGLSPIILQSAVQLRPDFGLNTVIANIPNTTVADGDTTITSQDITLFGTAPGTGKPFMRNPTSCKQQTTTFSAVPYSGSDASGTASFTTTGCDNLDFSPTFTARVGGPGQTGPGRVPTTAITSIDQDPDEAGLVKAQVLVPPSDLAPNLNLFGSTCPPASFQASSCPAGSVVGSAIASSPLLSQPLAGNVMLVDAGTPLPNIGLDLNGQLHLLLQGSLDLSQVVTFDGLPDIPIAHFQLTFAPSPGLLLANRDLCVPPPPLFHADFQGYNGASTSVDSAATVEGCGPGAAATKPKCKSKKKRKHRAAEAKKKHKKKCKRKKRKKRR